VSVALVGGLKWEWLGEGGKGTDIHV